MNSLTIILSVTASLLVAALILVWQDDTTKAKNEPSKLEKYIAELEKENKELKQIAQAHQTATKQQSRGIPATSPYGNNTLTTNTQYQTDLQRIEQNKIKLQQLKDRLPATAKTKVEPTNKEAELAAQPMSNSALLGASSNALDSSTDNSQNLQDPLDATNNPNQANIQKPTNLKLLHEIRTSLPQAKVVHVEHRPDGDLVFAKLEEYANFLDGSELAIRRHNAVAGKVKILKHIETNDARGTLISLEVLSKGMQKPIVVKVGDELILPPLNGTL